MALNRPPTIRATLRKNPAAPAASNHRHNLNVALNVGGIAVPVLAGVLTIPPMVRLLGEEGFATLALGWTVVGYFSMLDLGLGKALTMRIARDAGERPQAVAGLARTGRRLMLGLGLVWTVLLLALFPLVRSYWPVLSAQTASPALAWALLVLCIPFTLWFANSGSLLEARSRFVDVNVVRIPMGIGTYGAPLLAALYTRDIAWIFGSLLATRVLASFLLAWPVRGEFAQDGSQAPAADLRGLLKFGGWMTVSHIVGPVLVNFDRFAIAAIVSVAAVTHYTVPFDVLTRLPLFPMAVMSVLFPLFVQAQVGADTDPTTRRTLRLLLLAWLPGTAVAALLGPELLRLWVGHELAAASSSVAQWLIVGVAVNGLAHLPLTLLQSRGRTDVVAWLHLAELPVYLLAVWWALQSHGIAGAAFVWTLRVTVDAIVLHLCARKAAPQWSRLLHASLTASVAAAAVLGLLAVSRT